VQWKIQIRDASDFNLQKPNELDLARFASRNPAEAGFGKKITALVYNWYSDIKVK